MNGQEISVSTIRRALNSVGLKIVLPRSKPFIAIEFREEKSLRTLSWSAQSPDLNSIENLWNEIKQSLKNEKKGNLKILMSLKTCEKNLEVDLSR